MDSLDTTALSLADEALGDLSDPNDLFCTGKVRMKMATEKCRITGQSIIKHRNGKVDLGAVLDDPRSREHVCPYCSYSFAYKHVLERHVRQIHEKHLLCTYQCPKCTYSTVRKDQMRSHYSVVHEDFKPFYCSECAFRAPKAFRVTSHIEKNHGGKGTVIHDTNLRPRPVSPPPPEVLLRAKEESFVQKAATIGIDALPEDENQQVKLNLPEIAPKTNKLRIAMPKTNKKRTNSLIEKSKERTINHEVTSEAEEEEHFFFHCPYCDFKSDIQIIIGDHVVLNHVELHIARNAKVYA